MSNNESWFGRLYHRWLQRRNPPQSSQRLHRKNIFILPSKAGFGFLLTIILLWLLGTNYQNNLIIAFTFLLLSLLHTCIFYTYRNFSGLSITAGRVAPCFSGGHAQVPLVLQNASVKNTPFYCIDATFPHSNQLSSDVLPGQAHTLNFFIPMSKTRGWCRLSRLTLSTSYPLGLIKAWSHIDMDTTILVYPKPIATALPDVKETLLKKDSAHDQQISLSTMAEDISHLRAYQAGDSPRQIAWKAYAKTQKLVTKAYESQVAVKHDYWLCWDDFSGVKTEERLSRLCDCVLQLEAQQYIYGLELPNKKILPNTGIKHQHAVLRALALYDNKNMTKDVAKGAVQGTRNMQGDVSE